MSFTVCHTHNEPQIVIHCEGDNIKMYCKQCFLPHIATKTGVILNEKSKTSLVEWNQFLLEKFKEIQANIKIKGLNALYEMKLNASYPRGLISQLNNQEMGQASIEIIDKYLNTLATNIQFISTRQTIQELCIPELLKDIYVFFVSDTNKSLGFLAERIQALLRDQLADKKIYEFVEFIFAPKEIRVLQLKRKIIVKNVQHECLLKKQETLTPMKNSSTPPQLSPVAQVKIFTPTRISQQSPTISRNLEENMKILEENKLVVEYNPSQVNNGSMSTSQVSRTISDNGTIISEETIINQLTPKRIESDFVRQRIEVQQRVPSVDQDISIQNIAVPNLVMTQRQSTQSNFVLNRNSTQTSSILTPRQSTGQSSILTPRQSTEASSRIISRQSTEVSSRLTPTRLNTESSSGIVTRQISSGLVGSPQTIIQRQSSQLNSELTQPQLVQGSVLTQSPIRNAHERQGQNIINIQPSPTKQSIQSTVQSNPVIANVQKLSTQSTATIQPQPQPQPPLPQMQMPSQVSTQVPSQNDLQAHSQVSIQILPQIPQNSPPQLSPQKVPSQQVPPHPQVPPKPITQSEQYKSLQKSLQQKELEVEALHKEKLELQHSNAQLSSTILKQEKTIKTQQLSIRTLNNLISNQQQQIHYRQNQVQILTQQIHKLILYKTQNQQLSNKLSIAQKQLAFKDKSISCLNNLIGNQEEELLTRENQVEVLTQEITKLVQWKNRYHRIEQQMKEKERVLDQRERGIKELNNLIGNQEEELAFREGQVQMLTSQLNKAKQHISALQSTITSQQSEIQSLQSTITSQKQKIQSLQSTITSLQPKISDQKSQIQSLQSTIASQQSEIQQLQSTITSQQSEIQQLQSTITSLQPKITSQQSQIKSLQSTIASQQSTMTSLQSTICSQHQKITSQQSQITQLQPTIASQHSEIQSLQSTIASQHSEIQSLQSELSQYKQALKMNQQTQKATQKQIQMLKLILKQKQQSHHYHQDQGTSFDQQLMEQVIQLESDVVARNMEIQRLVGVVNRLRGVIKEGVNEDVKGWLRGFKIARFQQ